MGWKAGTPASDSSKGDSSVTARIMVRFKCSQSGLQQAAPSSGTGSGSLGPRPPGSGIPVSEGCLREESRGDRYKGKNVGLRMGLTSREMMDEM